MLREVYLPYLEKTELRNIFSLISYRGMYFNFDTVKNSLHVIFKRWTPIDERYFTSIS